MENTNKPAGSLPSSETLPHSNVPQSGQSLNPNAQPVGGGAPANHAVTPHGEPLSADSEEAIQARIAQSRLDSYCRRNPSVHFATHESAQIASLYDENYTGVQPTEFYRFNSAVLAKRGYF